STERVVRSRGAAGSEGEVVRGLTAAAFTPTGSAGGQGQGERGNGRRRDASHRHWLPFPAEPMGSAPLLSDRPLIPEASRRWPLFRPSNSKVAESLDEESILPRFQAPLSNAPVSVRTRSRD